MANLKEKSESVLQGVAEPETIESVVEKIEKEVKQEIKLKPKKEEVKPELKKELVPQKAEVKNALVELPTKKSNLSTREVLLLQKTLEYLQYCYKESNHVGVRQELKDCKALITRFLETL